MKPGLGIGALPETYSIRPSYKDKFCPLKAKEIMKTIVEPILLEEKYSKAIVSTHLQDIADNVRTALRDEYTNRYKIMVQVVIGEKKGQGVRIGSKCFWDSDTDNLAFYSFMNDNLYCVVVAFASYFY
jgi:tctex1 domain-containing protein 2